MSVFSVVISTLFSVLLGNLLYFVDNNTTFLKHLNKMSRQIIFGIIFGLLAISGELFGVHINLSQGSVCANCRNIAPIVAGLTYGLPCGTVAGLIAGVGRFLSTEIFGVGAYSQITCSIMTIVAGILSGIMSKYILKGKYTIFSGIIMAIFVESVDGFSILVSHYNEPIQAFLFMKDAYFLTIIATVIGTGLFFISNYFLFNSKDNIFKFKKQRNKLQIFTVFKFILSTCMVISIILLTAIIGPLETNVIFSNNKNENETLLKDSLNLFDDIIFCNIVDTYHGDYCDWKVNTEHNFDNTMFQHNNIIKDICVIDNNGEFIYSTNSYFDKKNVNNFPEISQSFNEKRNLNSSFNIWYDINFEHDTAFSFYYDGSYTFFVNYDSQNFLNSLINTFEERFGLTYHDTLFICDSNYNILKLNNNTFKNNKSLEQVNFSNIDFETIHATIEETDYQLTSAKSSSSLVFVAVTPENTLFLYIYYHCTVFLLSILVVFTILLLSLYISCKKNLFDNIVKMNDHMSDIVAGNFSHCNINTNYEFTELSCSINTMVDDLQRRIQYEKETINKELETARAIQQAMLPCVFPAFPDMVEIDLFASMDSAKEVGGDFYDFYFVNDRNIVINVADVSGKGIPAAMFMMTSKALMKNSFVNSFLQLKNELIYSVPDVGDVFSQINDQLCLTNDTMMFVTSWLGCFDIVTGTLRYINAGHNPPLIKTKGSNRFEYIKNKSGLVLAVKDDEKYESFSIQLKPGDIIFLYTDGLTEANNSAQELYGEERLINFINSIDYNNMSARAICLAVKEDVAKFASDTEQFDDITMLCLKFKNFMED